MIPSLSRAYKLFHNGSLALAEIEVNGIRVDTEYLDKAIRNVEEKIRQKEEELRRDPIWKNNWARRFGAERNLDSNPQLAAVLFEECGYKPKLRTPKGKYSTSEEALEELADEIPFVKKLFSARKDKKTLGTYLLGIRREQMDGYLRPLYSLAGGGWDDDKSGAISYRGACQLSNFQNYPIRNPEMAAVIRPCFIPRKGRQLVEVDFSTLEVRVAACYCKDPTLIGYMKDESRDMHRDTACDLFFLKPDQVVKKGTRDAAKNMYVFPQFYGSYYVDCAKAIWKAMHRRKFVIEGTDTLVVDHLRKKGIKELGKCDPNQNPVKGTFEHHVKEVDRLFWEERFPVYTKRKKEWWNDYLDKGYFDSFTGFRWEGVFRRNQVLNFRVQGAAFHCLLQSIIWLQRIFRKKRMKALIVGQIHDSLLIDAPPSEVPEVLRLCKRVMTVELPNQWKWMKTVPFKVEADVAPVDGSWHQKKAVVL